MARPECRFISKLSKSQVQRLEALRDTGETTRIRHRAHAILLSSYGTTVNELVEIFQSNRTTIGSWLDRWDTLGFEGIADMPRSGAPPKLNDQEQLRAIELLQENPRSSNAVLITLKNEIGIEISGDTLRRLAKKKELVWKRMRKSLRSKRDQKKFATQSGTETASE